MSDEKKMIEKRSWAEFQDAGLIWWVNRALHLFGWALVVETDKGEIECISLFIKQCEIAEAGGKGK